MKVAVIIPAAGFSRRFGEGQEFARSKLDEDLGGRSVLQRTIEMFTKRDEVHAIIVAGPYDEEAFAEFKLRHGDKLSILGVTICRGGKTHRYETVAAALEHVPDECTHIAVHDAARPCTPVELLDRVFDAAAQQDAVVPAIEVDETLKRVSAAETIAAEADPVDAILGDAGKANTGFRTIEETIDRTRLMAAQTPQVFKADLLRRAYAQDELSSTDDASLVERLGEPVVVVRGDPRNIKITRSADLRVARAILGVRSGQPKAAHKRF
ncbi:MAG: 2-C-methyl-D-erythritol 4-phosphate cytidylyltransferase [Planctomycetes bacterium]|nr:2-C-methyl-D-erythritol 4-phosphate cytidylyltransferase [Planctomycetota bacterium]